MKLIENYKNLGRKEFIKQWGEGINKVTPLQQTNVTLFGQSIIICGIIVGLITTFIYKQWWLFIILTGSLFVTSVQIVGTIQRRIIFVQLEKYSEGGKNDKQERTD